MARVRVYFPGRRRRALTAAGAVASVVLATAGVVAMTASAQAVAANLVQNPGFESGSLSPWSCSNSSGSVVTSPTHSGSYALQAMPAGNDDAQCSQTIAVQPSSSYTLTAWTQGSYVYLGDSGTGTTDSSTWTSSSSWTQQTTSFTTGVSTTSVTIWLHGWYGQGTYYADDISLTGPSGTGPSSSGSGGSTSASSTASPSASASASASPSGSSGGGSGGNLLANPGFESGSTSGWSCSSNDSVVGSPVHSGSYALSGAPSGSDYAECSQTVSVQPGTTYSYSGWVDGSYVYLGGNGGNGDVNTWTAGTSGYQQLSVSITTGASQTSLTVYVHGWYGEPAFYADDFSLTGPGGSGGGTPSSSPSASASPSASPSGGSGGGNGAGLPKHVLTGYWQDFTNGATVQRLTDVNSEYDIIAVAFANATGTAGQISFAVDSGLSSALGGYTDAQFKADIATMHSRGKKVILSVGGQNGTITVNDSTSASNFASSAASIIQNYGFDGIDIDLENGVNATYMAQALHSLASQSGLGSGFILTMAPQTTDMQNTSDAYFQLALNVKDILTIVNMQYYNSGSMVGCDGNVYSEGTEDFLTALACIQLKGGLAPSQVGLGVPASTSAAGSGYVSPSVVDNALDCLASGTNCGTFKPGSTWPGIGGAMTWSTNWDASAGNQIANTIGAHLHAMP
jgi:chitinase